MTNANITAFYVPTKSDVTVSYKVNGKVFQVLMSKGYWTLIEDITSIGQITNMAALTKLGVTIFSDSVDNAKKETPFGNTNKVENQRVAAGAPAFAAFYVVAKNSERAQLFSDGLVAYLGSAPAILERVAATNPYLSILSGNRADALNISNTNLIGARFKFDSIDFTKADVFLADFSSVPFGKADFSKLHYKNGRIVPLVSPHNLEEEIISYVDSVATINGTTSNGFVSLSGTSLSGDSSGSTFVLSGLSTGDTTSISGTISSGTYSGGTVVLAGNVTAGTITYTQINTGNTVTLTGPSISLTGVDYFGAVTLTGSLSGSSTNLTGTSSQGKVSLHGNILDGYYVGADVYLYGTATQKPSDKYFSVNLSGTSSGSAIYSEYNAMVGTYNKIESKGVEYINGTPVDYAIVENSVILSGTVSGGTIILSGLSSNGKLNLIGSIAGGTFDGGIATLAGSYLNQSEITAGSIVSFTYSVSGNVTGNSIQNTTISISALATSGNVTVNSSIVSATPFSNQIIVSGISHVYNPPYHVVGVRSDLVGALVKLGYVDFTKIDFCTVDFSKVDFNAVKITKIDPTSLAWGLVDLSLVSFLGVDFTSTILSKVDLTGIDLSTIDGLAVALRRADFSKVNLPGKFLDFGYVEFNVPGFIDSTIIGQKKIMVSLDKVDFTDKVDFSNAKFSGLTKRFDI